MSLILRNPLSCTKIPSFVLQPSYIKRVPQTAVNVGAVGHGIVEVDTPPASSPAASLPASLPTGLTSLPATLPSPSNPSYPLPSFTIIIPYQKFQILGIVQHILLNPLTWTKPPRLCCTPVLSSVYRNLK